MKRKSNAISSPEHLDPSLDVDGGFLCLWSYWRPDPDAADPEMPGLKQQMVTYISVLPHETCLCGSGRPYKLCCRPQRYWRIVCPNLGLQGYSLLAPQEAIYDRVDGDIVRTQLMDDVRFQCVEDTAKRAFWILWGDPALESKYGISCFGDIELQRNRTLIVTAMSEMRMAVLLDVLAEMTGLSQPVAKRDPVYGFDKRTGKRCVIPIKSSSNSAQSWQKRRL